MPESFKNELLNRRFKAAIIGCGNIGGGYDPPPPIEWSVTHAGGYFLCPHTELIAAADTNKETLHLFGGKWGVKNLYMDYRELLEKEEVDILSICLPTDYHYQVFKDALNYNISAFFLEKPLCYRLEDGEELLEISKGRVIAINYFRRWNPSFSRLKEEIVEGNYGKIIKIKTYYTKEVIHNASHGIDLLRYLIGEPSGGRCISQIPSKVRDYQADFYLNFSGDIQAYFIGIQNCEYNIFEIDILTEKGRILLAQRGQQVIRFDMVQEPFYRQFDIIKPKERVEETEWRSCSIRATEDIIDCLLHGGNPSCTIEDGFRALEISLAVLESGQNNSKPFKL